MRKFVWMAALFAAVALAPPGAYAATELIVNGSFELPDLDTAGDLDGPGLGTPGSWQVTDPSNWGHVVGVAAPEIQNHIWKPQDGQQYVELDSHGTSSNTNMFQLVQIYAGNTYDFSFWWAPRPNANAASNSFEYYIADPTSTFVLSGGFSAAGNGVAMGANNDPGWRNVTGSFTALTSGLYSVGFRGTGTQDTLGVLIDNVSLVVPVPAAAGLGVLGMGLLPLIRRRKAQATK